MQKTQTPLAGMVALVTGASRGVGKGTAVALAEAGATVYITGRTVEERKAAVDLPGTIGQTAAEIRQCGAKCTAIRCDHRDDEQTAAAVHQIRALESRLDILINNVWGGYEHFNNRTEFWKERGFWTIPLDRWDSMFAAGVRAHYVTSALAVPLMMSRQSGVVVNISFEASTRDDLGVAYGAAKAADDHMVRCMPHELKEFGIAVISVHPGLVRTEAVLKAGEHFDLSASQSPKLVGEAIARLVADPQLLQYSGQTLNVADMAKRYQLNDALPRERSNEDPVG